MKPFSSCLSVRIQLVVLLMLPGLLVLTLTSSHCQATPSAGDDSVSRA